MELRLYSWLPLWRISGTSSDSLRMRVGGVAIFGCLVPVKRTEGTAGAAGVAGGVGDVGSTEEGEVGVWASAFAACKTHQLSPGR